MFDRLENLLAHSTCKIQTYIYISVKRETRERRERCCVYNSCSARKRQLPKGEEEEEKGCVER